MVQSDMNNLNATSKTLEEYVLLFLRHSLGFEESERLLLYTDEHSDPRLAKIMQHAAIELGAAVRWAEISAEKSLDDGGRFLVREIGEFRPTKIIELSEQYYYQTPAWRHGVEGGAQIYSLCGLTVDGFLRCIGQVNERELTLFGNKLSDLLLAANVITVSSGDHVLSMHMGRNLLSRVFRKLARKTGSMINAPAGALSDTNPTTFLGGQIGFLGVPHSINGEFVVQDYVWPPDSLKRIDEPVVLVIRNGNLVEIRGQCEASVSLRDWFCEPRNPLMHVCLGFNPGASFSSGITEAERVMGSVTLGIGEGALHCDSVSANATVKIDTQMLVMNGEFVHPELRGHADRLTS